jgi:hypothetical protein
MSRDTEEKELLDLTYGQDYGLPGAEIYPLGSFSTVQWLIQYIKSKGRPFCRPYRRKAFSILTMSSPEVILVTGANTGLGYQIIRALCSSDKTYNILLSSRSLTKAQDAVSAAIKEFPSSCSKLSHLQIDIEDDDSIQRAFQEMKSKFGRVDTLINNAGTACSPKIRPQ